MKKLAYLLFLFIISGISLQAQDINIYGFSQALANVSSYSINGVDTHSSEAILQQANIFILSKLGQGLSGFVNFEFTDSYSSSKGWGSFALQELFLKYEYTQALKIKVGQLIPKFGHLHDIYNRTPLLPYIIRPFVYEKSNWELFNSSAFLVQRGFVQVYGSVSSETLEFEYSGFMGSASDDYISSSDHNPFNTVASVGGHEQADFKTFGGRIGILHENFALGFSGIIDKEQFVDETVVINPDETMTLGDISRYKYAVDLRLMYGGFNFTGEYIKVGYNLTSEQENSMSQWNALGYLAEDNIDKTFWYTTLSYEITDKWTAFGYYSQTYDNQSFSINENTPIKQISFGAVFKPAYNVALKLAYYNGKIEAESFNYDAKTISTAVSISF